MAVGSTARGATCRNSFVPLARRLEGRYVVSRPTSKFLVRGEARA